MQHNTTANWFILGAGAMGCLWAASLKEAQQTCSLIIRPESREKYNKQYLTLKDNQNIKQFIVHHTTPQQITEPIQRLIIAVKANDAINAINSIRNKIAKKAVVVILINGIGIQEKIAEILLGRHTLIGCSTDGAWTDRPLSVTHAGKGLTWIGTTTNHPIITLPYMPRLDIRYSNNIQCKRWEKLVINSVINGLTARYHCLNGELLSSEERIKRVEALAHESERVLTKSSICLPKHTLELSMAVIKNTSTNKSSTLQDVEKNRMTELPWINGFLLSEGERLRIKLPEHRRLMYELKQMGIQ